MRWVGLEPLGILRRDFSNALTGELSLLLERPSRRSLFLLSTEPGVGPRAEATAREVRKAAVLSCAGGGQEAHAAVVHFAGRGAANFDVLLGRLLASLEEASVKARLWTHSLNVFTRIRRSGPRPRVLVAR
eukprot:s4013_g4.t1